VARTKIEVNPALVRGISGLDDLARILFPDNRDHRRIFVAMWTELKYADDHFLPSFNSVLEKHDVSPRVMEIVRARMKKLGVLKRISHFNPHHGHVSGWTFSERFSGSLRKLADTVDNMKYSTGRRVDEQKDRDSINYV